MDNNYLSIPMTVSVNAVTKTDKSWTNWAKGHNQNGNIQRPNMKSVYVKGTEKTPTKMSDTARLIRNARRFLADLLPKISTTTTTILPVKASRDVIE